MSASKAVYIVSLGCPKNRVDSEVMLGDAGASGHRIVADPAQADVIVVNTCGFIESAKEESIETILEMAGHKGDGRCEELVVTGCLSQRYPEELAKEIPEIDHMLGSGDFREVIKILNTGGTRKGLPVLGVSETPAFLYDHNTPRVLTGFRHTAYVKIAEGCDRPCAFCIIPKLRGPQRSRTIDSVVKEVENLCAGGTKEINLIAQDLTRFGVDLADEPTLAQLLAALEGIDGLHWVRLHYTYPSAFTDELIDVIAESSVVAKYVDVPLQHIDDAMLKKMRRGHGARTTHELLDRLRSTIDGLVLRSTFIVGHPGETDESFAKLCEFIQEAKLDHVGAFPFSTEEGTTAAMLPHRVPEEVKLQRQEELMELQRLVSRSKNEAKVGETLEILVEGISDESEYLMQGRWYGQAPEIDGSVYVSNFEGQVGDLVMATVTDGSDYDLAAEVSPTDAAE
ncbi:MAG: 30S ribosomal protein S12 methylthiotransferase RimO [Myxococcales bacterium]|nr:30S ribosomal protein S12 methylthiotransferase RimO [Myxococcales bacterium]